MINNYRSFILLESIIRADKEFLSYIRDICNVNDIANMLLKIIGPYGDYDAKTNYNDLSVGKKNSEVSFIPDNQYQRFLAKGEDISKKTKSSIGIGRMVKQLLKDNFGMTYSDKQLEEFINLYKTQWDRRNSPRTVEIVKGDDILHWYDEKNYLEPNKGILGNSCMRFAERNYFMRLYSDNPDTVSMVIIKSENKLIARAILWKLSDHEFDFFLDRIYTRYDSDSTFLYEWVVENVVNNNDDKLASYYSGNYSEISVIIKKVYFDEYPYMDTLKYLYKDVKGKGGYLMNQYHPDKSAEYIISELQETNGFESVLSHKYSKKHKEWIVAKDSVWVPSLDDNLRKSECDICKYYDRWYAKDDLVYSEKMDDMIPKDDSINDPDIGWVIRGFIIDIIDGYIGNEKSPVGIYNELAVENFKDKFKVTKSVKSDKDFYCYRWINTTHNNFRKNLLVDDMQGEPVPKMLAYELYRVNDPLNHIESKDILPLYENDYITKEAAKFFNIKTVGSPNYVLLSQYIYRLNLNFYALYLNTDLSKFNTSYKEEYDKFIKDIHEYRCGDEEYLKHFKAIEKYGSSRFYNRHY